MTRCWDDEPGCDCANRSPVTGDAATDGPDVERAREALRAAGRPLLAEFVTAKHLVQRESIEEALENDRCGICGSVDHFREDCPGDAAMELLALCDRLDQAREAWLPRRYAYPSHPTFEQDAGDVQAVWSDGARTTWVECEDEDDAALIVAAVNSLPELVAAVRRLLADRQAVQRVADDVEREWRGQFRAEADDVLDVADRIRRALGTTS